MKLHLGCGKKFIPGFTHIDCVKFEHVDYVANVADLSFIEDEAVTLIYASHVLEHFSRYEYMKVLSEWHRVLRYGGILRISVPDFEAVVQRYLTNSGHDCLDEILGLLVGGQRDEFDYHKMVFDKQSLQTSLLRVGFSGVQKWEWSVVDHSFVDDYSQAYLPHMDKEKGQLMSLNIEAIK